MLIKIQKLSFMKMHLKKKSAKWLPYCPEGYELMTYTKRMASVQKQVVHPHYLTSLMGEIGMRELPYGVVLALAYLRWNCMYSKAGLAAYIETRMAIHVSNVAMSTSCWTRVKSVSGFLYSVEHISVYLNQTDCIRIRQNGPLTR